MDRNWRFLRSALLASCSSCLLALPGVVHAQAASDQSATTVDELVVTAQKREQRLVDVPVTVAAVNSEQLQRQNITTIADLSRAVPDFGDNGSIRGMTTTGVARSSQGAVAIVLDGVDLGHSTPATAPLSSFFDVQRVEVLSGPQGTLFGTNASAGVINIITNPPDPTRFEAIGHADVGDYGYQREQLTLNVPVADTAAMRVSLHNDQNHGIVRNTITDQVPESWDRGVRARFLWEPTDDLHINLIGDYDKGDDNGQGGIAFAIAPTPALQARLASCGIVASPSNTQNCELGISSIPDRSQIYGVSGQVDYNLNGYTLTSISAYRRHIQGDFGFRGPGSDSDFLSANILDTNLTPEDDMIASQELRVTSPSGKKLEYVAGLFWNDIRQHDQIIQAGGLGILPPPLQIGRVNIIHIYQRTYAAFGQATYHLTDQLSLIAGARYTDETDKDVSTSLTDTSTPNIASFGYLFFPSFILAPVNEKVTTHNLSWKLGAQYHFSRDTMAYATVTRGFKGPAINDQSSPPIVNAIIAPEIPMNYEVGLKGAFLDNRLLASAALFYDKVKNFQTSVYIPPSAANPVGNFAQGNAPYLLTKGLDLSLTGQPTPELTLNAGLLYNIAKYAPTFLVGCSAAQTPGVGSCTTAGVTTPVSQLANTPKVRVLLNGEYAKEIRSNLTGFVQADLTYESKRFTNAAPDPITDLPAEWLLGGRIGVRASDGRWGLSLFGRNLLDKKYSTLLQDVLSGFDGGAGKSYWVTPAMGRTWGITLDARY